MVEAWREMTLEKVVRFEADRKKRLVARVFRRCRLESIYVESAPGEQGLDVTLSQVQAGKHILFAPFAYGASPCLELSQLVQIELASSRSGDARIMVSASPVPGEEPSEEPVLRWCEP